MKISCPKCGVQVLFPEGIADKALKCPRCNAVFKVATKPSVAPATAPAGGGVSAPPASSSEQPAEPVTKSEVPRNEFKMSRVDSLALAMSSLSLFLGCLPLIGSVISGPSVVIGLIASLRPTKTSISVKRMVIFATIVSFLTLAISAGLPTVVYLYSIGVFGSESDETKFADAQTEAIDCGDVTVLVRSVQVFRGALPKEQAGEDQKELESILVRIRLENRSQDRPVFYFPYWKGEVLSSIPKIQLQSANGNMLTMLDAPKILRALNAVESETTLKPGEALEDVLIFGGSGDLKSSDYQLRLPAAHLGYKGVLGFEISKSFIKEVIVKQP